MKKLFILFSFFGIIGCVPKDRFEYNYSVKINYCDNRPPKFFTVRTYEFLENSLTRIDTYKRAVPTWSIDNRTEINVCEAIILKKVRIIEPK